jgi:hypothetical protein
MQTGRLAGLDWLNYRKELLENADCGVTFRHIVSGFYF